MNPGLLEGVECFPGNRVANLDAFDAVEIEHDAQRVVPTRHPNVDHFTSYTALPALEVGCRSSILEFDQLPQQIACFNGLANMTPEVVFEKGLGRV